MDWFWATRKQVNRLENRMSAIQVLLEHLYDRNPSAILEAASKCFHEGVEASKVESFQANPVYLDPEARADYRKVAEARGRAGAASALHDPNNAKFIADPDCERDV